MKRQFLMVLAGALLLHMLLLAMPHGALAQTPATPTPPAAATPTAVTSPLTGQTSEVCTTFSQRNQQIFGGGSAAPTTPQQDGLLTEIYKYIKEVVTGATEKLFNAFINNTAYQVAVGAAITLMVIIFGVGFMIGAVQPSFGEVLKRLIKLGLIIALVSPGGWAFFNHNVVSFFNDGTDQLVTGVVQIGTGVQAPTDSSPFYQFDKLAEFIIQPETIAMILGSTFAGGPYGLAIGGLMLFALGNFVRLLIQALKVYAVSYVARSLILGLAPIFFVFLLFERTKQLFMQWVNALVSLALQPILLFTFLSFFIVLIESAAKDMLSTEFCWTEYNHGLEGMSGSTSGWRPVDRATNTPIRSDLTWKGTYECVMNKKGNCPEFPMNVVDVLTFLILIYLAQRFAAVIERIANELANTYIALDPGGRFDQFMSSQGGGRGGGGGLFGGGHPSTVATPRTTSPPPSAPQTQRTNPPPSGG